jgi:hypothetical protein
MKWLRAAVQLGSTQAFEAVCRGCHHKLDTAILSALFWQAMQLKHTAIAARLLIHPAKPPSHTQQLHLEQHLNWPEAFSMSAYLRLATELGCSSIGSVCSSRHCQQVLSATAACGFLERAIESSSSSDALSALCSLSGAQQLQPEQAVTLLLQALKCGNTTAVSVISRRLPAAQCLATADNLQDLLQAAAARGLFPASAASSWFSTLRNQLNQLPHKVIEHAVQLALATYGAGSAVFQGLLAFLQGSVQWLRSNGRCHRKEVKQWEAHAVARLLATAVQVGDAEALCMLCKVPAAKRIRQDSVMQLLHSVLMQQQWQQARPSLLQQQQQQQPPWQLQLKALHAVLELPGASCLPTSPCVVSELLQQAVAVGTAQQVMEVLVRELRVVQVIAAPKQQGIQWVATYYPQL